MAENEDVQMGLSVEEGEQGLSRKRSYQELEAIQESDLETTPLKRRRTSVQLFPSAGKGATETDAPESNVLDSVPAGSPSQPLVPDEDAPTPTPRRRGRPPKAATNGDTPTPKAKRTALFQTPTKKLTGEPRETPRAHAADRSARRKSAKALIQHVVGDELTDEEEDDGLVRQIYEDSEEDEGGEGEGQEGATTDEAATPSKTPRRRGRPKKKARSPTPPRDLPPHELYFVHNKPGRPKTSENTLGSLAMLSHDEYFAITKAQTDRHAADIEYLETLHAASFPQWEFELSQGFSVCLYGFGSKRRLLRRLVEHLHERRRRDDDRIAVINGYAPALTLREVLATVASALTPPSHRIPLGQPAAMAQTIRALLAEKPGTTLTLAVHSVDAPPLRRPGAQAVLAQLAADPQVRLLCSADTPDFPLLWDAGVRSAFGFVFHDCTTFAAYGAELDVVDEVHALLGRDAMRVNGREGVAFVLRSLPENAKNLFRLLVGEVLIAMEDEGGGDADEPAGVEYRMVYNKAVEEFICSSEMAFRTLLKEFHDHQIITSMKDALGTDLLSLPFRKDELEAILEDLTS